YTFAEGPAADTNGNLYFSDIPANRIYKRSVSGILTVFRENSGSTNGLFLDQDGSLLACEGGNGRVVDIDSAGSVTVLADKYNGNAFNEPNDLWVAPNGGVYFTDPVYITSLVQDGEHVYYLSPDRQRVVRVIDDMVRPNGIVGTADGSTLYVTDHGAGQTYRYTVNSDGTLSNKTVFASVGADGMTIDTGGNLYLCENGVLVYDASGNLIESISVPEQPTNVCFGGTDGKTLFITTRSSVYSLPMKKSGVFHIQTPDPADPVDSTPDSPSNDSEDDQGVDNTSVVSSDDGGGSGGG
ncbi:MAG: SMP-30/gluconolactonase/LRE family protein, partial [Proteobacteria bacterium]|nr:SMP-30/gluconolactonase/LRE family protein [Pseudomonadota bacterium]